MKVLRNLKVVGGAFNQPSHHIRSSLQTLTLLSSHPKFPLPYMQILLQLPHSNCCIVKLNLPESGFPLMKEMYFFLLPAVIEIIALKQRCAQRNCSCWQIHVDLLQILTLISCRVCSFRWGRSIFWGGGSRGLSELFRRPNLQLPGRGGDHHRSWLTH